MATFISALVFLLAVMGGTSPAASQSSAPTEPMCYDWGESSEGAVSVVEGEVGWLSCPLFSHPSVYNYTSTQSAGHNLFWYRLPEGHDLEQPITYSSRLSKDRERLFLQPAAAADTGQYICMLRNKSSCSKIAIRLKVLRPDDVVKCALPVAVAPIEDLIPLQEGKTLDCPDLQDATKMSESAPKVQWYFVAHPVCDWYPFWDSDREQKGNSLQVHLMMEQYQGLYYCRVQYQRRNQTLNFTRSINVTAILPLSLPKEPSIMNPTHDQIFTVKTGTEVRLVCRGQLPFVLDKPWREIWWTVDGKTLDKLPDRFTQINRVVRDHFRDLTIENILVIQDFQSKDLKREFYCSVKNERGFDTRRAQLEEEVSLPTVELGCGLGVTLLLMLILFVVYHVFWLELLLLYRSWFGTDERHTDDKEFDVYISYARNSEEEQFVLLTLRRVLENELGYSVCIFDRDSLPGGNLSEAILQSMQRSRRLLLVLSPNFLAEKSFSLLECRLGLYLENSLRASIIAVVYRSVSKLACVEVPQLRQATITTVTWRGTRSEPRRSRFWLRLRLALPVRPLALGRRLIDSTSSHSDLAAMALQRAQRIQSQSDRTNQGHRNGRTNVSRRDRRTQPRGYLKRGVINMEEGPQHSRSCSGCAGFMGNVEGAGVELTVETQTQQEPCDRTEVRSDPVPETHPNPVPNSAHDAHCSPNPTLIHHLDSDSALTISPENKMGKHNQQQAVSSSRTSEEVLPS
ncbi:interleukin-1 receptor accessory protein isoform X1 [Astatotilapia calliptera]|uniref:interleukin-1 receptor accessory protein isoform X1 n=2 Tax=Astatotilapia calliptera TaxID=8154 RepID=UPI000E40471C|nr:interleukin-1 receptor accessory protein isoform X1 [Astatotilapia calliptera]